jgi:hypothetical protein
MPSGLDATCRHGWQAGRALGQTQIGLAVAEQRLMALLRTRQR